MKLKISCPTRSIRLSLMPWPLRLQNICAQNISRLICVEESIIFICIRYLHQWNVNLYIAIRNINQILSASIYIVHVFLCSGLKNLTHDDTDSLLHIIVKGFEDMAISFSKYFLSQNNVYMCAIKSHYSDAMIGAMVLQITCVSIVCWPFVQAKKIPKLRVTGLCVGNSPVTGEFPAQRASKA